MWRQLLSVVCLLGLVMPQVLFAQRLSAVSTEAALRHGLERAWHTRIQVDSNRGQVLQVTPHVSATDALVVFEVVHPRGTVRFAETAMDRFGDPLGKAGAAEQAARAVVQLIDGISGETSPELAPTRATAMGVAKVISDCRLLIDYLVDRESGIALLKPDQFISAHKIGAEAAQAFSAFMPDGKRAADVNRSTLRDYLDSIDFAAPFLALPTDANPNLPRFVKRVVPTITLYALTTGGIVQAIDGETGRTRWVTSVGDGRLPSFGPSANDEYVAVINGRAVYILSAADGQVAWSQKFNGGPGAGPTLSNSQVFVPRMVEPMIAYNLRDPKRDYKTYFSNGNSTIQPTFTGTSIAWPTDRGTLHVVKPDIAGAKARFNAQKPAVVRATHSVIGATARIFFVSLDGFVYCVRESGSLAWRFSTGAPISQPPITIGDAVYVVSEEHELFRLSAATGNDSWQHSVQGIRRILASSGPRLYCEDLTGGLAVVGNDAGTRIGTLPIEVGDLEIPNSLTDRIFIASRTGLVQCLHEPQNHFPVLHPNALELIRREDKSRPAAKKPKMLDGNQQNAAPVGGPAFEADAFGAPADDAAMPAGERGAGDPDPFGDK